MQRVRRREWGTFPSLKRPRWGSVHTVDKGAAVGEGPAQGVKHRCPIPLAPVFGGQDPRRADVGECGGGG